MVRSYGPHTSLELIVSTNRESVPSASHVTYASAQLTKGKLERLVKQGFKIRQKNRPDHAALIDRELAAARQMELYFCAEAYKNPSQMEVTMQEMQALREEHASEVKGRHADNTATVPLYCTTQLLH